MKKQRTLFFQKRPEKTAKKDGTNPPVPERRRAAMDLRETDRSEERRVGKECRL